MKRHDTKHHHAEEVVRLIFRGLIPIILLSGGLILLTLKIPGWSLIFGLPITIIGTVFLIYTYDYFVNRKFGEDNSDLEE